MHKKTFRWCAVIIVMLVCAWVLKGKFSSAPTPVKEVHPVRVATALVQDVPEYYSAIGSVTPFNSTLVQSRVDGYLVAVHFTEGQRVQQGDLLVEIDPRPFEIQLLQAEAALARDMALLKEAQLDFERYKKLRKEESVSLQQLQQKESLLGQYEAAVEADKASIEDAKLQLTYSRVTAPISGRLGLKNVDIGDMVRSSDTSGLVRITQTDPTYVVFTLVEKVIPDVLSSLRKLAKPRTSVEQQKDPKALPTAENMQDGTMRPSLLVEAWNQQNTELLASGVLVSLDNQIDSTTGTVKAKAIFDNPNSLLFPNQFVNVRLLVRTLEQAIVVPSSSIQRGSNGFFVFVAVEEKDWAKYEGLASGHSDKPVQEETKNADSRGTAPGVWKVRLQPVQTGYSTDSISVITSGLIEGELVVTDGVDRLRNGALVSFQKNSEQTAQQ